MRVLLDKECAAVAGGHESQCVADVTTAAIMTGAAIGAAAGAGAGGVGAIPGAVAGAGVGSLVAQVAAPTFCSWFDGEESGGEEEEYVDPEVEAWSHSQYAAWHAGEDVYAPHEYVADGASY